MDDGRAGVIGAHSIVLTERERMDITGIIDVVSFDETTVVLNTKCGELVIDGSELHIVKLNVSSGEAQVSGVISAMSYYSSEQRKEKGGIFSRVFK